MKNILTVIFFTLLSSCTNTNDVKADAEHKCIAVDECILAIHALVMGNWKEPNDMNHIVARVKVKIKPNGTISELSLAESSGNAKFDKSAISAIESSAPFTLLQGLSPEDFSGVFSTIYFQFSPTTK